VVSMPWKAMGDIESVQCQSLRIVLGRWYLSPKEKVCSFGFRQVWARGLREPALSGHSEVFCGVLAFVE